MLKRDLHELVVQCFHVLTANPITQIMSASYQTFPDGITARLSGPRPGHRIYYRSRHGASSRAGRKQEWNELLYPGSDDVMRPIGSEDSRPP